MRDHLISLALFGGVGGVLVGLPRVPGRGGRDLRRGLAHVVSGLLATTGVLVVQDKAALLVAGALGVVLTAVCVERGWIGGVLRGSRLQDYGFVAYAVAFVVLVAWLFPQRGPIVAGLLVLALADPVAAAVGRRIGRARVTTGFSERSVEGAVAFTVVAAAVLAVVAALHRPSPAAFAAVLLIAVTAAAVELLAPPALDNLFVPLWVAFLFSTALSSTASDAPGVDWLPALAVAGAGASAVWRFRWLDPPGAVLAFLLAAGLLVTGGWAWLAPLVVFLASTSVLTKANPTDRDARGLEQTVVNGLVPALPVVGHVLVGGDWWYAAHVAIVAVACADTWASELGRRLGGAPVSIRSLKRVGAGTSGAVSAVGLLASVVGGGLVGAVGAVAAGGWRWELFLVGVVVGPLGALVDTVLGAWAQCRYRCVACGLRQERPRHCGERGVVVAGVAGLTNERVNLVANIAGPVLASPLLSVVGPW
ncbi:DUF92 domain-containing protein [Saccharothrix australiensis]|uniref:Uncharacterized protein (TIGR00297 family) n=1 Tax=Saccharothrix australiensis TaxID=2072 RepID=A0A495W0C9_9PSEU|nr:DUF92 domain-containing protein [Saccharothrix australiensis]RKT55151.1 uncharacterized protein (TIGR00297 family) [Saccharothrix australiensis]